MGNKGAKASNTVSSIKKSVKFNDSNNTVKDIELVKRRESSSTISNDVLRGTHECQFETKLLHMYICSSSADMQNEIEYLMRVIRPQLIKDCKNMFNVEFQFIDMNSLDFVQNVTPSMRLQEIRNCQGESIGYCVLILIGNKYGQVKLADKINKNIYELIETEIKKMINNDNSSFLEMFQKVYKIDENRDSNAYYLLKEYQKDEVLNYKFESNSKLKKYLELVAKNLRKKELFDAKQERMFSKSIFECEIEEAIYKSRELASRCLVFARNIKDIKSVKKIESPRLAERYFDTDSEDSEQLIEDLKRNLANNVDNNQFYEFNVDWALGEGVSIESNKTYFKDFGEMIINEIILNLMRLQMNGRALFDVREGIIEEIKLHKLIGQGLNKMFFTNENLVKISLDYINSRGSKSLIIYGSSGSGKSTLISKIAHEVIALKTDRNMFTLALRFAGITPRTKTLYLLYESVVIQLCQIYDLEQEFEVLKQNKEKMNSILIKILNRIESLYPEQKIFILLDGLNELEKIDKLVESVIVSCPSNAKIIYTVDKDSKVFEELKRVHVLQANYYPKDDVKYDEGVNLLKTKLNFFEPKRQLAEKQMKIIEGLFFKADINQAFIHLVFLIVSKWSSFYEIESKFLTCINVDACFDYMISNEEREHNQIIFSRCLFYLTIFKFGIQDCEMEGIMNIDPEIRKHLNLSNLKMFPVAFWIRIRRNLKDLLAVKQFDYVQVNSWNNKRLCELAKIRYVNGLENEEFDKLLTNIIYYFLKVLNEEKLAFYNSKSNRFKFNKRLIRSLPFFIFLLKDPDYKVNALKKYIYYNSNFVFAVASINDRLFVERAPEIWSLYIYFENNKIKNHVLQLSITSYAYQRNLYEMNLNPKRIYEILDNDKKLNFNDSNTEISRLLCDFKNFEFVYSE